MISNKKQFSVAWCSDPAAASGPRIRAIKPLWTFYADLPTEQTDAFLLGNFHFIWSHSNAMIMDLLRHIRSENQNTDLHELYQELHDSVSLRGQHPLRSYRNHGQVVPCLSLFRNQFALLLFYCLRV